MTINLEEIISAAVENRIRKIVDEAVNNRGKAFSETYPHDATEGPTSLESYVSQAVTELAREEVAKHKDAIRKQIQAVLAGETPARIKIDAYSKIELKPLPTKGETL